MTLPPAFRSSPIAHRGLHDIAQGRLENCRASFAAAARAGYGIELDVHLSADGAAVVFHDSTLDRLSGRAGRIGDLAAEALARIPLIGTEDRIETLAETLDGIPDTTPVLVEIKSDGAQAGPLCKAVAEAIAVHENVAVMSFDPNVVAEMARLSSGTPRGLTTPADPPRDIVADYARAGACFVAHDRADLGNAVLAELRGQGAALLSWTIGSQAEAHAARRVVDNIIFEGFRADVPA